MEGKKNYKKIGVLTLAFLVGLVVAVFLLSALNGKNVEEIDGFTPYDSSIETTDEEKKITKEILENQAEVIIEGYQRIESEDGLNDVVVITVRNTSEKRVNFGFDVVALDENDNVLGKTSLYAEGIEPGQVHIFNAFALSGMTPEQMQTAHFEVYKAKTYVLDGDEELDRVEESK